jgi:hypothetical protein
MAANPHKHSQTKLAVEGGTETMTEDDSIAIHENEKGKKKNNNNNFAISTKPALKMEGIAAKI